MAEKNIPLRESKRRATFDAIEDAATALVAARGFDDVTVDEICERAGIARRTFFNYVDSKETAVFGYPLTAPDEAVVADFAHAEHPDLLEDLLDFYLDNAVLSRSPGCRPSAPAVIRRRKTIGRREPETVIRRFYHGPVLFTALTEAVTAHFAAHPGARRLSCAVEHEARAAVTTVVAAAHLGMHDWVNDPGADIAQLTTACHKALNLIFALDPRKGGPQ